MKIFTQILRKNVYKGSVLDGALQEKIEVIILGNLFGNLKVKFYIQGKNLIF